ncbi:MAG: lamin tail domain-containing protein [Anaerolineae bacterium]
MNKKWLSTMSVFVGLLLIAIPVLAADADVIISEVMFNTHAIVGSTDETPFEWVEIYNKGDAPVDIANWYICDASTTPCDQITTAMCPGSSCSIPANTYWIIANNATDLATELANYGGTVDNTRTIFLSGNVAGNGLSNSADTLYLARAADGTQVVDCVSWASTAGTGCSSKTYITDGTGIDTALANEGNGQSITNVQGTWYYSKAAAGTADQATPYSANEGYDAGGNVTLVDIAGLKVNSSVSTLVGGMMFLVGVAGLVVLRKRK